MAASDLLIQHHLISVGCMNGVVRNAGFLGDDGDNAAVKIGCLGLRETDQEIVARFKGVEVLVIQFHFVFPLVHAEDLP